MNQGGGASRLFGPLVKVSNWVGSAWVCVLMALIVADVLMRTVFNAPIVGVNELMEMSIVAMLYLQVTQALRDGRHTRSDAFFSKLEVRWPKAAAGLNALFYVAGFVLMLAILYAGIPKTLEAYQGGFTVGNPGVFIFPEWPVLLIILYGCALMAVQFASLSLKSLRLVRSSRQA